MIHYAQRCAPAAKGTGLALPISQSLKGGKLADGGDPVAS